MYSWGDFHTFLTDNDGRVYRYWVRKKMFTPYEMDKKFIDQSEFEDTTASLGVIAECVELGNGDFLLGFRDPDDEGCSIEGMLSFYRLSDISLNMCPSDQPSLDGD